MGKPIWKLAKEAASINKNKFRQSTYKENKDNDTSNESSNRLHDKPDSSHNNQRKNKDCPPKPFKIQRQNLKDWENKLSG